MKAFSSHKHGNNTGMCLLLAHNKKGCIYIKLLLFNFIGARNRSVLVGRHPGRQIFPSLGSSCPVIASRRSSGCFTSPTQILLVQRRSDQNGTFSFPMGLSHTRVFECKQYASLVQSHAFSCHACQKIANTIEVHIRQLNFELVQCKFNFAVNG